jgi:predicted glycoside hydrolase/deacetylase ChbG (UPF0249 family)
VTSALAERLGYASDARLLIVTCDDLGSSIAANVAIADVLRRGTATDASLMTPCADAPDAIERCAGLDIGVHLTLTCERASERWGPLTAAASLRAPDGAMRRTTEELWDEADLDDVRRECRAQIVRALDAGVDVTHLDSHMLALQFRARFVALYLDLAAEHDLPLRMISGARVERVFGFPFRTEAARRGLVFPDHLVRYPGIGVRRHLEQMLRHLPAGVTELYLHPAVDGDELRRLDDDWERRVDDHACLAAGSLLADAVDEGTVTLIGYRALRDLQRRG